jgi:hypothetical protein
MPQRICSDSLFNQTALKGVCSIFLRVDRSLNEIYNPMALFAIKLIYKKYVFIDDWNFLSSQLIYV